MVNGNIETHMSDKSNESANLLNGSMGDRVENAQGSTIPISAKVVLKQLAAFSSSRCLVAIGTFITFAMLSKLDEDASAAIALINPVQSLTVASSMAFFGVISNCGARKFAQKKHQEIGQLFRQGIILSGIVTPINLAINLVSPIFYSILGQNPSYTKRVAEYFLGYSLGMPAVAWAACEQEILLATQNNVAIVTMSVLKLSLRLIFSYALIFGNFGLPKLGFFGLGLANSLSTWISIGINTFYMYFSSNLKRYNLFKSSNENMEHALSLKELFTMGNFAAIQTASQMIYSILIVIMAGWSGGAYLQQQQIVFQYFSLLSTVQTSITKVTGISVSNAVGKLNQRLARISTLSFISFSAIIDIIATAIFTATAPFLAHPFLIDDSAEQQEIISVLPLLFILNGINQIFNDIKRIDTNGLRSYNQSKKPLVFNLISIYFFSLPLAFLLGIVLELDNPGFSLGSAVGSLIGAMMLTLYFFKMTTLSQEQLKVLLRKPQKNIQLQSNTFKLSNVFSGLFSYCTGANATLNELDTSKAINTAEEEAKIVVIPS